MAARMLVRGPKTEAELEERLVKLGYQAATAAATVARCRELGYVGDAAYARERACGLRARGAGCLRIAADLGARGLPEAQIEAAIEDSRAGESEGAWAERALARLRFAPEQPRERARAWRHLAARGFPEEVIMDLLGSVD